MIVMDLRLSACDGGRTRTSVRHRKLVGTNRQASDADKRQNKKADQMIGFSL
jgi:hypothetical protein